MHNHLEIMHIFGYNDFITHNNGCIYERGACMTRKMAREEAFILIFEKAFNNNSVEEIFELAAEVRDLKPDDYINRVFVGVYDYLDELDDIISEYSVGWKINRISKTALSVMRLALYEIKYMDDIPYSVTVNEAVELCKKYATTEDASFVNGILSTVLKKL